MGEVVVMHVLCIRVVLTRVSDDSERSLTLLTSEQRCESVGAVGER